MSRLINGTLAGLCPILMTLAGAETARAQDMVIEERYERHVTNSDEIDSSRDDAAVEELDDETVVVERPQNVAVARCSAQYRSFDPVTGTFVSFDGTVRPCPYLN